MKYISNLTASLINTGDLFHFSPEIAGSPVAKHFSNGFKRKQAIETYQIQKHFKELELYLMNSP
jgi:hypothetical protein